MFGRLERRQQAASEEVERMRKELVCMAVVLGFVLAPLASQADDMQDQMQRMEDRMANMEDRLQATNDQLDAANDVVGRQQEIIDRSGIADQTASSGVAAFLDSLELGGWLAGSYFYNFNDPRWSFTPAVPWEAGAYALHVETILEDLAGNTLRSLFDVDLAEAPASEVREAETIRVLPFVVKASEVVQ